MHRQLEVDLAGKKNTTLALYIKPLNQPDRGKVAQLESGEWLSIWPTNRRWRECSRKRGLIFAKHFGYAILHSVHKPSTKKWIEMLC